METDPGQTHDVAAQQPVVAAQLKQRWRTGKKKCSPDWGHEDRPFTVGYPDFPITALPARDGVAHGHIKRSSNAPNSSYFTNWTSPDDSITWDVAVERPANMKRWFTTPVRRLTVGSTIELSLNGSRIQGVVSEPNDPPLCGRA